MDNQHEQHQPNRPSSLDAMSFGDVARYLQGGFDRPVQEVIANHFQYANDAHERLASIRAMQAVGKDMLVTNAANDALTSQDELLDEMELAALIEQQQEDASMNMNEHIGASLQAYLHFANAKQELALPTGPRFQTPAEALALVRAKTTQTRWVSLVLRLKRQFASVTETLLGTRERRWALAFATVVILGLATIPSLTQTDPAPSIAYAPTAEERTLLEEQDMLVFSPTIRSGQAAPLEYKLAHEGSTELTWPALDLDITAYSITFYDATDMDAPSLAFSRQATSASILLNHSDFTPQVRYQVYIEAELTNGGIVPVGDQSIFLQREAP